ncbi:NLR family CARD domain-containing protein 3-like [Sebastes fasciatus]|uniref:NLR family CARD domain-containing protein 3-like n=1 Tax=Sebastes fasciatus TaxID=394691 RepID=UPI003D9F6474
MGTVSKPGLAVDPETSPCSKPQIKAGSTAVTAQYGSAITTPQLTDVIVEGDITINVNMSAPSPVRTDNTFAVSPKTEENKLQRCSAELKSYLRNKTKRLSQGTKEEGSSILLNKIYTDLYITKGGSGEVNNEHEVIQLLNDILKPSSDEENLYQRVLMKGTAGIGKTVAVQKFIQDLAAGKANQTIQFIFPITFRDLNLLKNDDDWSLTKLIGHFFKEVKDLEASDYSSSRILFILDGLDECRLPLDFENNEMCRSVTKTTTVDVLLTNLISGKLLHKAWILVTSRPAAATKIPPEYIDKVIEVRGFNDEQKEEYFKNKVVNNLMAQNILDHLQSKPMRSLYNMCRIPFFCWISATVLQNLLTETDKGELPKALTEMHLHFLICQTKCKHQKHYQEVEEDKYIIMKHGKLAFEQLQKGKTVFYEKDLKSCKIDLKAAVYSGLCTQSIRKEYGLHKQEIYSFTHLSIQEFLAALYVSETFLNSGENLLTRKKSKKGKPPILLLHKDAVNMALASDCGRWDMFLRFLLGLSQDKNQKLLQKVLRFEERRPQSTQDTVIYIQGTIIYIQETNNKLSNTDKSIINLSHCLNELGDQQVNNDPPQRVLMEGIAGDGDADRSWFKKILNGIINIIKININNIYNIRTTNHVGTCYAPPPSDHAANKEGDGIWDHSHFHSGLAWQ